MVVVDFFSLEVSVTLSFNSAELYKSTAFLPTLNSGGLCVGSLLSILLVVLEVVLTPPVGFAKRLASALYGKSSSYSSCSSSLWLQ